MAATTTIRVREQTRRALAQMAERGGQTIPDVVDALVARASGEATIDAHLAAVGEVADLWEGEIASLDGTLGDGLADDPWPVDADGEPLR